VRAFFARLYQAFGGLYVNEMKAWAEALDVSMGTATMLNCAYELSQIHVPTRLKPGCTAGARWVESLGMVHARSLDWPLPGMGSATRVFRFRKGQREFVVVGVPGQVGVLSGMVPRGYSVTINWAPPATQPSFSDFGPTFLLRQTLETCDTFADAVEKLWRTPLSASVFFTVCGIARAQACVIERTRYESAIRKPDDGGAVVQANHHLAQKFAKNNNQVIDVPPEEEEFSLRGSSERYEILRGELRKLSTTTMPTRTLDDVRAALQIPSVLNRYTTQQMVFCPLTGDVKVWSRIDDDR
jgi:predicted choloylglycine hydrolase